MVALWLISSLVFILITEANAVLDAPCRISSQCGRRECCAERVMIASKRLVAPVEAKGPVGSKTCQPYLNEGQACGIFFSPCGCTSGLQCLARISNAPPQSQQRLIIGGGSQSVCVRNNRYLDQ